MPCAAQVVAAGASVQQISATSGRGYAVCTEVSTADSGPGTPTATATAAWVGARGDPPALREQGVGSSPCSGGPLALLGPAWVNLERVARPRRDRARALSLALCALRCCPSPPPEARRTNALASAQYTKPRRPPVLRAAWQGALHEFDVLSEEPRRIDWQSCVAEA